MFKLLNFNKDSDLELFIGKIHLNLEILIKVAPNLFSKTYHKTLFTN